MKGIYDLHIEVQGVPLLPWEPPELSYTLTARLVNTTILDRYCLEMATAQPQSLATLADPGVGGPTGVPQSRGFSWLREAVCFRHGAS